MDTQQIKNIFNIEVSETSYCLVKFAQNIFDRIKLIFITNIILDDETTYHISKSKHEFSLFLPTKLFRDKIEPLLKSDQYLIQDNYSVIKLYETTDGISHIGIVSKISTIFANEGISILYVNSYDNNYIFVETKLLEKALSCLENN